MPKGVPEYEGNPRCSAHSKRTGEQCKRTAEPGRTVCRYHGGKSPRGVASPSFVHGRYSRSLTGTLAARYHEATTDPELLSVRDEIALLDARISEVLAKIPDREPGSSWRSLRSTFVAFRAALAKGKTAEANESLDRLGILIGEGENEAVTWTEIGSLIGQRARLSEVETRRLVEARAMLRIDELGMLIAGIVEAVRVNVKDREVVGKIVEAIERLPIA